MYKNNVDLSFLTHQIKTMRVLRLFLIRELTCLCIIGLCLSFVNPQKNNIEFNDISFANIKLSFTEGVQKQIEVNISAYPSRPFLENIHQIEAFLNLLDETLDKEEVPRDYKYLCLHRLYLQQINEKKQGFWDLSEQRAENFELRVDEKIDERFNILSSTYQVSREMRRNNIYFANWLFNMLSLDAGFQKAKEYLLQNHSRSEIVGKRNWLITEETHPLIREVITFKLFIEQRIAPQFQHKVKLKIDPKQERKTLKKIAADYLVSQSDLEKYNLWLRKNRVPSDKIYPVLIPIAQTQEMSPLNVSTQDPQNNTTIPETEFVKYTENTNIEDYYTIRKTEEELRARMEQQEKEYYDEINRQQAAYRLFDNTNNVEIANTHQVLDKQTLHEIAAMYNIQVHELRAYNQLSPYDDIYAGQVLYLKPREASPQTLAKKQQIHVVALGENLSSISRKYDVSVQDLMNWNQLSNSNYIRIGQKLLIYTGTNENRTLKTGEGIDNKLMRMRGDAAYQNTQQINQKLAESFDTETKMPKRGGASPNQINKKPKLLWIQKPKK